MTNRGNESDSQRSNIARVDRGAVWRARLRTGNRLLDELVTRATGKAYPGQKPMLALGGMGWWATSTVMLLALLVVDAKLVQVIPTLGWGNVWAVPLLAVNLICTTGRLRAQQVSFGHHAVHRALCTRWPAVNAIVQELSTALALVQNPSEYFKEHVGDHHKWRVFTTATDPDAKFLLRLGFRPAMSRKALKRRLWWVMVSPGFHGIFAWSRIESALVTSSWRHRLIVLGWVAALGGFAACVGPLAFVVAVVLPIGPLYQISALLQFLTEHRWLTTPEGPKTKEDYASRCVGRFALVEPPAIGWRSAPGALAWSRWALAMVPQLMVRMGVWVADLPAHDHHHQVSLVGHQPERWHESIFDRERAIEEGDRGAFVAYEAYGIGEALDRVFAGMESSSIKS